jgi:hypothetical protein
MVSWSKGIWGQLKEGGGLLLLNRSGELTISYGSHVAVSSAEVGGADK